MTRSYPKTLLIALMLLVAPMTIACAADDSAERPNILFIAIDDLRNDLGALGADHTYTPRLDSFAEDARLFSHQYTQVPSCGPSRAALLSGRYPASPAGIRNRAILETGEAWEDVSLPSWFRQNGYQTLALGKISHYPGGKSGEGWAEGPEELPNAWDSHEVPAGSPWETPQAMMHGYANGQARIPGESPAIEAHAGPDTAYPDAWVAAEAIETLDRLAESSEPWLFAVGFFKPHLPFAAPQSWFDKIDPESIPVSPHVPDAQPDFPGWHPSYEMMRPYTHGGKDPREDTAYAVELRHAYAAATAYADEQVGRVLDRLNALGLDENTIVVIWSDHGFALGEHGTWGKHSLYEEALRAPLLIKHPGMPHAGAISHAVVETVDIFPTLTELAGLSAPPGLDGHSLTPQLQDPDKPSTKPALAWHRLGAVSVRTPEWRWIRYHTSEASDPQELFDFREDPAGVRTDSASLKAVPESVRELMKNVPVFE